MKAIKFYLTSTLLLTILISSAQNQWNIIDPNSKWSVITNNSGTFDTHFIRFSEEDTLINGFTYRMIYNTYHPLGINWTFMNLFIREDSMTRKVFLRDLNGEEALIYDFSAELGDTITIRNVLSGPEIELRVINVDSVLINDALRKRYQLEPVTWPIPDVWVEGIGSIEHGIIYSGFYNTSPWYMLLCYNYNNVVYYQNPDYTACYYPYVGQDEFQYSTGLSIFPNPSTNFISIFANEGDEIIEVVICNHLGQNVLTTKPVNNTVDISRLKAGIYFIEMITGETRLVTKLLIE